VVFVTCNELSQRGSPYALLVATVPSTEQSLKSTHRKNVSSTAIVRSDKALAVDPAVSADECGLKARCSECDRCTMPEHL
jgi:hypothetical protein